MKTSTLLASVLAVLIASGVSFGAGYFTAKSESAETPEARPVVAATDSADSGNTNDAAPLGAPNLDDSADKDNEGKPGAEPSTNTKPATGASDAGGTEPDDEEFAPAGRPIAIETRGEVPEGDSKEDEKKAADNIASRLKDLEDQLGDFGDADDLEELINGERIDFTGTVSGTVVDSDNVPVPNAEIYATTSESYSEADGGRVVNLVMSGGSKGKLLATADGAGYFTATIQRKISKRAKLRVELTGTADGYADSEKDAFVLENGGAKEGINLKVRAAGAITGRVVDQSGRGVDGVKVTLSKNADAGFGLWIPGSGGYEAVTDISGEFRIEKLPAGRFKFSISAMGVRQISGPTEIDVQAGRDTRAAADFVVAATAVIKCSFKDGDGKPVSGWATLIFKNDSGADVKRLSGAIRQGTFEANDPPAGNFDVEVQVWGYETQTVRAAVVDGQPNNMGALTLVKSEKESGDSSSIIIPGSD